MRGPGVPGLAYPDFGIPKMLFNVLFGPAKYSSCAPLLAQVDLVPLTRFFRDENIPRTVLYFARGSVGWPAMEESFSKVCFDSFISPSLVCSVLQSME